MGRGFAIVTLALWVAGCGPGGNGQEQSQENAAAAAANVSAGGESAEAAAAAKLPPCPFRDTGTWKGSVEGGRLLVTGTVDLQMAGFKPQLTARPASGGVAAFDLALTPESGAAVNDKVRFERSGSPRYSAGEIWCGGERLARFDMINL
jgi:hypothetical protein